MGQTELQLFLILINLLILIFISGIVIFLFQYRRRKLMHEKEKELIEEQNRAALLDARVATQLQTMEFIGSEIHDSVAQKLTIAVMHARQIELENKPAAGKKLHSISDIVIDALAELRELSKTLTDAKLQQSSFIELVQQQCLQINNTGICCASLHTDPGIIIPDAIKGFLFRVVQEFVQNSLKHSGCMLISVGMLRKETGIELHLSDDGRGFDLSSHSARGFGLNNMKRRILLIGGTSELESEEGRGTQLHIYISQKT